LGSYNMVVPPAHHNLNLNLGDVVLIDMKACVMTLSISRLDHPTQSFGSAHSGKLSRESR
jgi:hypothetical protein